MTTETELCRYKGLLVAPFFRSRFGDRRDFLDSLRARGAERPPKDYAFRDGDYGGAKLSYALDEFHPGDRSRLSANGVNSYVPMGRFGRVDFFEPVGLEKFLIKHAERLLELKGEKSPVVMLDLGGFMGQSWSRIALELKDEIESSNIALVVSNLIYHPDTHLEEELAIQHRHLRSTTAIEDLLGTARPLVKYVNGSASELKRKRITLPNGDSLKLTGNVDLIHELFSLTFWSHVPELEVAQLGRLLSEYGMHIIENPTKGEVGRYDEVRRFRGEDVYSSSIAKVYARRGVIVPTLEEYAEKYGLRQIEQVEGGSCDGYPITDDLTILSKPDAPIVESNYRDEEDLHAIRKHYAKKRKSYNASLQELTVY